MIECPACGSRDLRYSKVRGWNQRLRSWFGVRPLRCRDCRTRFITRTWDLSSLKFARCPHCWRMDLNHWSLEDYHATGMQRLMMRMGAHAYRCEYCRRNFVSYRPRKEKFSFKRWAKRVRARKAPARETFEAATGEQ